MKNQMKERKGITLIALVITIIVLLILAGVTIATLTGDNGLLQKAASSKQANEKGEIEEQIKLAYNDWKLRKETGEEVDLQNTVQTTLDKMYDNVTISKQGKSIIINVKGHEFTLVDDGTIEEGQVAYLDIADGSIQLKSNGYIQGSNALVPYTGKYIITGTTVENIVQVTEQGTYDITIRDLNIDVRGSDYSAFNGNVYQASGWKHYATGLYVNISLEGNNVLRGGGGPGLAWVGAEPNLNGVKDGSTLTIDGNGRLEAYGGDTIWSSAIGNNYSGGDAAGKVNNIVFNGGNIFAKATHNKCGIEGGNITINGGNIEAIGDNYLAGIGGKDILTINGGNIISTGGYLACGITCKGTIRIQGGNLTARGRGIPGWIGDGIKGDVVEILGGTISSTSEQWGGVACYEGGSINITGSNLYARGNGYNIRTYESSNAIAYYATDGTNNLYETPVKLQNIGDNKKITRLTTSDNIEYGIKDMYTLENGMLYLYLPTGTRTITIEVDGKTYSGSVQTTETPAEVILNEIN